MSEDSKRAKKRIKSLTVRFNKEVLPFQHIRVEVEATITKEDDADEVAKELKDFAAETFRDVENEIYRNGRKATE